MISTTNWNIKIYCMAARRDLVVIRNASNQVHLSAKCHSIEDKVFPDNLPSIIQATDAKSKRSQTRILSGQHYTQWDLHSLTLACLFFCSLCKYRLCSAALKSTLSGRDFMFWSTRSLTAYIRNTIIYLHYHMVCFSRIRVILVR